MVRVCRFSLVLCAVFALTPCFATDFGLRPDRFTATPGATLGAEIVVFGASAVSVPPPIGLASVVLSGAPVPIGVDSGLENQRGQRVSATLVRPGWAVWFTEGAVPTENLASSDLELRLWRLHAPPTLRALASRQNPARNWRLSARFLAKCIVRVGEPDSGDRSWTLPTGGEWDLAPQFDPVSLRAGKSATFAVWTGNRPVVGTVVTLRSLGDELELEAPTGSDGKVALTVPSAGLWLASASHVQVSASDESLLEVRSASLVFEVR